MHDGSGGYQTASPYACVVFSAETTHPVDAQRPYFGVWTGTVRVSCGPTMNALRKIIHVDMDAFYASVEQRDDPALRGERLCPDAVFVPPDFARYKAVSRHVREIFLRHTDLVEPLSLDEAYL